MRSGRVRETRPRAAWRLLLTLVASTACLAPLVGVDPCAAADDSAVQELPSEPQRGEVSRSWFPEYRPGQGVRFGSSGLVVGAFTNIKAESTSESGGEFALDQLNFFLVYEHSERSRAVAELQLKDIYSVDEQRSGTQDFAFDVRRLFFDFAIRDELRVRVGTFLTPVGDWNLIQAPPLTWTTERPLIVEETFFQETTTGAMIHGSEGLAAGRLSYALFSQFLDPLEDNPDLAPPDYTAGARIGYDVMPVWSLALTYQAAETRGDRTHLVAGSASWLTSRSELRAEVYLQDGNGDAAPQWGAFAQGVLEVRYPVFLVGRYEFYSPPGHAPDVNVVTVGATVRPLSFMALKSEYRYADHHYDEEDLEGFFFSFSTFL